MLRTCKITLPIVALAMWLALTGCQPANSAKSVAEVTLISRQTSKRYLQPFSSAVFSRGDSGMVQIVLIDDGIEDARPEPGKPLQPQTVPPLREVLTIRLLWQPPRGAKASDPTSANATIDWYIIGETFTGQADFLHYQGAGFARVSGTGYWVNIELKNTTLSLVGRAGTMEDPLGTVTASGNFRARRDDPLTDATLADLRARFGHAAPTAGQSPQLPEHQGPPPRPPTGP